MYQDTVTVFNRYKSNAGDMWYPTVISFANVNIDKAGIVANYGEQSKDKMLLNVKYSLMNGSEVVDGKPFLPPKEWARQTNDKLGSTITFNDDANGFDFVLVGEYTSSSAISDDDYQDGFFNYMSDRYDYVFAITSVSKFQVIPHFEITGK